MSFNFGGPSGTPANPAPPVSTTAPLFNGAPATPNSSFQFGAKPVTTPQTPGFAQATATPLTTGQAPATPSFAGFGQATTTQSTTALPAPSFNFGTNTAAVTSAPATAGFGGFGTPASTPSNPLFLTNVPAQTSTGMPYPKDTKFSDLPTDVQKAIETLETTIRSYEATSFQVAHRRYDKVDLCSQMVEELGGKLQVFDFAIQQNQNRMTSAKRNLNKYWKYGETVARHIATLKQQSTGQAANVQSEATESLIMASDVRFLESIICEFEVRSNELEALARDINSLLEHLQVQPSFSVQKFKATIRAHSEALLGLAEKLASFHDDIQALRNSYRQFCILYKNDSRDPFASKYKPHPVSEQQAPQAPIVAPKLTSVINQQQSQTPSSTGIFGGATSPSANSFFRK